MTPGEIILKYVAPGLGAVIAFFVFMSPMRTMLEVNRRRALEEVNALPFAMMTLNCISWTFYGFLTTDYFVYAGNLAGILCGFFYTMICFKFSKDRAQNILTGIMVAGFAVFFVVGLFDMALVQGDAQRTLWGALCVAILMVYYSAPMSTLYKVIKERSSASLHWLLCLMNSINGGLWFAYGLAIKDWFITIPNGLGAVFNIICLVFCLVFPRGDRTLKDDLRRVPDAGGNWAAVRLQSIRYRPDRSGAGGAGAGAGAEVPPAAGASSRSFLDLAQFRWRSGQSFARGSSFRPAGSIPQADSAAEIEALDPVDERLPDMPATAVTGSPPGAAGSTLQLAEASVRDLAAGHSRQQEVSPA